MFGSDKIQCEKCGNTCRRDWLTRHHMSFKCQRTSKMFEEVKSGRPIVVGADWEKREKIREKKREYTRKYRERLKEEQKKL